MPKDLGQPSKQSIPESIQAPKRGEGLYLLLESFENPEVWNADNELKTVISYWNDAVIVHDFNGEILGWNAAAQVSYGYREAEALGRSILDFTPATKHAELRICFRDLVEHQTVVSLDTQRIAQNERIINVRLTLGVVRDTRNRPRAIVSIERELFITQSEADFRRLPNELWELAKSQLSEMQRANENLTEEKQLFQVTLESIGDAVLTTDNQGRLTYLNPWAEELVGCKKSDVLQSPSLEVFALRSDLTRKPTLDPIAACLATGEVLRFAGDTLLTRRDGNELFIEGTVAPIFSAARDVTGTVLVFRDGTEKRLLVQQLSHQAVEDALTGLENRRGFERHLKQLLDSPHTKETSALLYLDLDQFKIVNDIGGHAAGDTLLRQIGTLMQPHIRMGDRLARLGGDEFGILLQHCAREPAVRVANNLRETIRDYHFEWEGKIFTVGASIGVVPIPSSGATLSSLLIAADGACYAAKERGGNRVCVYELNDSTMLQRHGQMEWVGRINEALRHDHFCLYYQPIISLSDGVSQQEWGEILLRLLDDDTRVILPQHFTPAAERYGLMPSVDRWVFRNSLAALQSRPSSNVVYSINISGHSLSDEDFLNFVVGEFRQTRVSPSQVCFEITETAAISNLSYAMRFISILKEVGCLFALDDFGTGLSSFAYLRNLPVNFVKIAGRFVKNMAEDPIDYAMVESIHHIAQVMGLETIAEHVEDAGTLSGLKAVGVKYVQGNLLGAPRALKTKVAGMA